MLTLKARGSPFGSICRRVIVILGLDSVSDNKNSMTESGVTSNWALTLDDAIVENTLLLLAVINVRKVLSFEQNYLHCFSRDVMKGCYRNKAVQYGNVPYYHSTSI